MSAKHSFLAELKRRHVFRVAIAYAVTAWLLLQLAAIVLPTFGAPHWVLKVLIGIFVLFFPVAVLLAWAFEMTPEGVRRTESAEAEEARPAGQRRRVGRVLNVGIIVVLAAAVGVLLWQKFATAPRPEAAHVAATPTPASAAAASAAASAVSPKSIAVLPFANDSNDRNQRYFSDGLSESLIIALSQYPTLTVIGRESSFQLRNTTLDSEQIGKKLGVATLLEGSVSHAGNEVRVRAELVSAATGRTLWSDQYDRPYKNLFALQDDLTKAVATALQAKLLGGKEPGAVVQTDRPPSGSLAAYNAYLRGNFYTVRYTDQAFRKAIGYYRQAIAKDPKYAAAYAHLAEAWAFLGEDYPAGEVQRHAYQEASKAAATALKLAPDLAASHLARGYVQYYVPFDWRGATKSFKRGLELDPESHDAKRDLAVSLSTLGRLRESLRYAREALAASPLDPNDYGILFNDLLDLGSLRAAKQVVEEALALHSDLDFHRQLARVDIALGDAKAALAIAKAQLSGVGRTYIRALAYAEAGDRKQADAALQKLISKYADTSAYQIAEVYAYRGEPNEAFAWLDRAWRQRDIGITALLSEPLFRRYQDDPRFAAFCKKVGLPTPAEIRKQSSPNPGTGSS